VIILAGPVATTACACSHHAHRSMQVNEAWEKQS
jgi:hypothetical protein